MTTIDYGPRDRQGPKEPFAPVPSRLPGSLRRTTTLDGLHPEGAAGPLHLVLRARDLLTDLDGKAVLLGDVVVRLRVDRLAGVLDVEASPADLRLQDLVGRNPFVGWRRGIDERFAEERGSLLYLLLDAVSGWMALAGFGLGLAPKPEGEVLEGEVLVAPAGSASRPAMDLSARADQCAGWQKDGTILGLLGSNQSAGDFLRPLAPPLADPGDPLGWHDVEPLPPLSARRCRRIDVIAGDPLRIDGMFRDSAVDADGTAGVLHEYTVTAAVDPVTFEVVESEAVPRSLPFVECPQAAGSAAQLLGRDVTGLRPVVGRELRGVSTCTHLNELYRTFADIGTLARMLPVAVR